MLKIERFVCNMFGENTYVVSNEAQQCAIIDCGALYDEERRAIVDYVEREQLTPTLLLATHGHVDHNFGNAFVRKQYGIGVSLHADDEPLITRLPQQAAAMVGMTWDDTAPVGQYLRNDDHIAFGHYTFDVIHTPGHTPGGVVYYCASAGVAFTGDTLFNMSVGRTDFPGGSWEQLQTALQTLKQRLAPETQLLTGHGNATTMAYECAHNPYLKA